MRKFFRLLQVKPRKAAKSTRTRTKKAKDSKRNDEEMEVLVSWSFSSEESSKELEPERIKVVEHILDVAHRQLFELC